MIVFLFSVVVVGALAAIVFGFVFMRSSKKMPSEWRQFKTEVLWQINGFSSLIEDHVMRRSNKVGTFFSIYLNRKKY